MVVSCNGSRLGGPRDHGVQRLRRAVDAMLVEANVTTLLLGVVAAVPVAGVAVAAAVLVPVTPPLVCVGGTVARPVAEPDVADRDEESAGFGACEVAVTLIGAVAHSFSRC